MKDEPEYSLQPAETLRNSAPLPSAGVAPTTAAARRKPRVRPWIAWLLVALIAWAAFGIGVQVRRWAWDQTTDIRFLNSVSNAIEWGRYANDVGVLNLYDELLSQHGEDGDYNGPARFALDYPPLRLFIATWWADWARTNYPPAIGSPVVWQPAYAFTWPMLRMNIGCEVLASLAMFLLVYRWIRICQLPPAPRWWTLRPSQGWGHTEGLERLSDLPSTVGLTSATLAMLLLWFNPAMIWNAHVYPQWDVWLLPAFLFAVYFGLRNWWLPAGIVVGISAMTKGQILLGFPLLLAWPLLMGNISGAMRLLIGLLAGVACVIFPWMLKAPGAWDWVYHVIWGAGLLTLAASLSRRTWRWQLLRGALAIAGAVAICWQVGDYLGQYALPGKDISIDKTSALTCFASALVMIALWGGRRWIPTLLAGCWGGAMFLCMPLLGASTGWYMVGVVYGTRHWKDLYWCHGSTLGAILQIRYQWLYQSTMDLSWIPWFQLGEVSIRQVMMGLYVGALAWCVVALVRHRRRHDPRLLLVLAAPFLASYTLLPQMVDRYLMWPAALLSAYAAISVSGLLLWLVLSLIACAMMAEYAMSMARHTPMAQAWIPWLAPTFPDIAWAIMVLCVVVLWLSSSATPRLRETQD